MNNLHNKSERIRATLRKENVRKIILTMQRFGITIEDIQNFEKEKQNNTVSPRELIRAARTNEPVKEPKKARPTVKSGGWNLG